MVHDVARDEMVREKTAYQSAAQMSDVLKLSLNGLITCCDCMRGTASFNERVMGGFRLAFLTVL